MNDDDTDRDDQTDEGEDAQGTKGGGEAGPPEDIEKDPAYNPDDPELKGIKGG
jgi:hypothetical protein